MKTTRFGVIALSWFQDHVPIRSAESAVEAATNTQDLMPYKVVRLNRMRHTSTIYLTFIVSAIAAAATAAMIYFNYASGRL